MQLPSQTFHHAGEAHCPSALRELPPLPDIALRLMGLLDEDQSKLRDVVGLVRADPALSAELLRVANSALYGLSRKIDSVSHAMVILGTDAVKRLALTISLSRFAERYISAQSLKACWRHSLATAVAAERLALMLDCSKDRSYTAGLVHDIGRLALIACSPKEYDSLLAETAATGNDHRDLERKRFGIDHCAAGEWLARQWQLPEELALTMAFHHDHQPNGLSTVSVVSAADRLADYFGFRVDGAEGGGALIAALGDLPLPNSEGIPTQVANLGAEISNTISTILVQA